MDGKRFGVGLATGLFLGAIIIAATGGLGTVSGLYGTFGSTHLPASQVSSTSTAIQVQTVTASATTSQAPGFAVNTSNSSLNSLGSTTNTASQKADQGVAFSGAGTPPAPSSKLASLPQQTVLSNAIVFLPILAALILGAILYRLSNRNGSEAAEAPP